MKYEQSVKDLYKIAGMLEMMTCMQDRKISNGMAFELADAVDKLELIAADLMNDFLVPGPCLTFKNDQIQIAGPETEVSAHEGSEESLSESQPPDQ